MFLRAVGTHGKKMKINSIIFSIVIGVIVFLAVGVLASYNVIPFEPLTTMNGMPRRYISLEPWYNFNKPQIRSDFDFVFSRSLYLLFTLQSFVLMNKLKIKNIFLIILLAIATIIVSYGLFSVRNFREYFMSGLNPIGNLFYVVFAIQILIGIYLNVTALRRLSPKGPEKVE